jgi:hypothetical protein
LRRDIAPASSAAATTPTEISRRVGVGNGVAEVLARDIDAVLHRERLAGGKKRLHPLPMRWEQLPDGAMVQRAWRAIWSPAAGRCRGRHQAIDKHQASSKTRCC